MNREILFKAKRKDNGEWVEGYYHKVRHFLGIKYFYYIIDVEQNNYEIIPETVCQYTGLNDKNGKKIFTDDEFTILQYDYENGYENSWGDIIPDEIKVTKIMTFDFAYTYKLAGEFDEDSIEVIGSIHDKEI